jgi:hypothetical protein
VECVALKFNDKWFIPVFLIALTILAALLRWDHIGWSNFFIDEAWSAYVAGYPYWQVGFLDVHPALSYALIKLSLDSFGVSEVTTRLVPFIFGVVSVPLSYWFGKEITGEKFPGLITALLMAISISQIEQAQNGRMYTMLVVYFMLFIVFFLKAYETKLPKYWYLTSAMAILAIWTWYYSLIPIGITILWYLLKDGRKILDNTPFLYSSIAFVFASALLVPSFMVAWSLKLTENNNLVYKGFEVIYQVGVSQLGSPAILSLFIALIAFMGWLFLFKDNSTTASYLAFLIFVSLAAGSLISYLLMILPRYFIYLAPIFYTLIGYCIYQILINYKNKWVGFVSAAFVLLIVMSTFCLVLPAYYSSQHNYSGDWNEHGASFSKIKGNATEVALVGNPAYVFMFAYYDQDPQLNFTRFDNLTRLKGIISGKDSLVLVPDYAIPEDQPEARIIYNWLNDNGKLKTIYRGFEVYEVNGYAEE